MRLQRQFLSVVVFLLLVGSVRSTQAAEKTALDLLPGTTFAYAELNDPSGLVELVLDHPLSHRLRDVEDFRKLFATPQYRHFRTVLKLIEDEVGMEWQPLLKATTGGGIYLAADVKTQGGVLLVQAKDPAALKKAFEYVLELAEKRAERKGDDPKFESSEHKGKTLYQRDAPNIGGLTLGICDGWLIASNKPELTKYVIDSYLDDAAAPLAKHQQFAAAKSKVSGKPTLWAYLDLAVVRLIPGGGAKLAKAEADNPGAEILFGGILANLAKTPYIASALYADAGAIKLSLESPHDAKWVGESREYFFEKEVAAAPVLAAPDDSLFSFAAYRDLSAYWLAAGELFDENTNTEMAKAESLFSTLFSGQDFATEVLPALEPRWQFIAKRQTFKTDSGPVPAIKLPSFAAIFTLKKPETMAADFKRTFQSLVGFLNVVSAQNGNPQLDFNTEKSEGRLMVLTEYVVEPKDKDNQEAAIVYNFSPSVGFVGNKFILASTSSLAKELADVAVKAAGSKTAAKTDSNTSALLDMQGLGSVLDDNRRQMVSQNMLEKGHTKEQAEKEIGFLLSLLDSFDDLGIDLSTPQDTLRLEMNLKFKND